jgi:hypothetical protein
MWIDLFGIHDTTSLICGQLSDTEIKAGLKMRPAHFG